MRAILTVTTTILFSTLVAAQQHRSGSRSTTSGPTGQPTTVVATPKNMLVFPYGVQSFEQKENLKVGQLVTAIPGWHTAGGLLNDMVSAVVTEDPNGLSRTGTQSKRWLSVADIGAGEADSFFTPTIRAPEPWNYAWSFTLQVEAPPALPVDLPALAIQHDTVEGFQDAWGVRLTPSGAELFATGIWGGAQVVPLFSYSGDTDVGDWVDVRVVASLQNNTLEAFVNGVQTAKLRTFVPDSTRVTEQRLAYHGGGAGNGTSILIDDLGFAGLGAVCVENLNLTFSTEDDEELLLVNGQDITTPPEFGEKVAIAGSGPNRGTAIFDSSNPGPNNPSQDPDLLVNQGNILILQTDAAANPPAVGGIFPRPNDDEDGGVMTFDFIRPLQPLSVDLIDIDEGGMVVLTLTDFSGDTRTYTVPDNWTGDITQAEPGVGTLDLQTLLPQAGFGSIATAVEDVGFDPNAVVSLEVAFAGSGGLDNLNAIIPCVFLNFETEDDGTPDTAGTALANGQDISTPPEFGVEVSISDLGPNVGAAIFDSTPGGPNDPGPDLDLLVGLGNILILQNNLFATQTVPGFFDVPNDDTEGGTIIFDFPGTVEAHRIDLIDVDEEESVGVTVILEDLSGNTRTYTAPPSWTEDRLNDGPPAFRTLDLETLAPQPGFNAVATAVEDAGFDPDEVIRVTVELGGAQAIDNFCFCP